MSPVIKALAVKNFQSLYDLQIPLSEFTVIVGASSSGKSAVIRALRLLLQNQRGQNFISHGAQTAQVAATLGDGRAVTIARGKENHYLLMGPEGVETFTKLGGEVPEEVRASIGIDPSLSVASQFDPPYLLSSSSQEIARTLGALTNVDTVLQAGREASRRRLGISSDLKGLQSALQIDEEAISQYEDLDERISQQEAVEALIEEATSISDRISAISSLLLAISVQVEIVNANPEIVLPDTEELFQQAKQIQQEIADISHLRQGIDHQADTLRTMEIVEVPDVDFSGARSVWADLQEVEARLSMIEDHTRAYRQADEDVEQAAVARRVAQQDYAKALADAKVCPTCGQGTEHLHRIAP